MSDKLEIGARVCKLNSALEKYDPEEDDLQRGIIEGSSRNEGKAFVKWDSSWRRPNPEEVYFSDLVSEQEAEAKVSVLEKEYNEWADQVKEKCQAAAALIREAGQLADQHGFVLGESYDLSDGIKGAMGSAGWNTSSWNC
jgi:hypothetical protein